MSLRFCRVSIRDAEGITHAVSVHAETLFEAAAAALAIFREQGWAGDALTGNAVLNVEVQAPAVAHAVPLKAVERWLRSPSASPREVAMKRRASDPRAR